MRLCNTRNKSRDQDSGPKALAPSIVAVGTVITGQVNPKEDLRIDGAVVGDICSEKTVIIGPSGEVRGNISAAFLDLYGYLYGNAGITGRTILRRSGFLHGNLDTPELEVEAGARFEGWSQMPRTETGWQGREQPEAQEQDFADE